MIKIAVIFTKMSRQRVKAQGPSAEPASGVSQDRDDPACLLDVHFLDVHFALSGKAPCEGGSVIQEFFGL